MSTLAPKPGVSIATRPMWRIRLVRALPRNLVCGAAVVGLLASARYAIAPPRALIARPASTQAADLAGQGLASLFVRRYLTWNAADTQQSEVALAPFAGAALEPGIGLQAPPRGAQRVLWTQVVQDRQPQPTEHVYTVAAETDPSGLVYLTVSVERTTAGSLAIAGYPAFVGPPALGSADARHLNEVADPSLRTVAQRALRNYLADAYSELQADLTPGARVSLPTLGLSLIALQRLQWAPGGGSVLAVVSASDMRGARYTLAYEMDVLNIAGRWEISAIQTDPTT